MGGLRHDWDRLHTLIHHTYDAAQDENLWPAVAGEMVRNFDSTSMVLQLRGSHETSVPMVVATGNIDHGAIERYRADYWQNDVWTKRATKFGLSRVVTSADLISDSEFERTEFYNEVIRREGIFYVLGAALPVSRNQVAFIGIQRPRESGDYDNISRRKADQFFLHLTRALQIRERLTQQDLERETASETVSRTRTATIVVSATGAIIQANKEAEVLMRSGDSIRSADGRIAGPAPAVTEKMALLIRGAAETARGKEGSAGGALSIPRYGRLPVTLLVAPFRPKREGVGVPIPAAIIFVRAPERLAMPEVSIVQGMLGLTPAEATIVCYLARGRSIQEIAVHHRLSLNTVRTHLKNIFAKTGTSRQTQLVGLVLRSVAVMTRSQRPQSSEQN